MCIKTLNSADVSLHKPDTSIPTLRKPRKCVNARQLHEHSWCNCYERSAVWSLLVIVQIMKKARKYGLSRCRGRGLKRDGVLLRPVVISCDPRFCAVCGNWTSSDLRRFSAIFGGSNGQTMARFFAVISRPIAGNARILSLHSNSYSARL